VPQTRVFVVRDNAAGILNIIPPVTMQTMPGYLSCFLHEFLASAERLKDERKQEEDKEGWEEARKTKAPRVD